MAKHTTTKSSKTQVSRDVYQEVTDTLLAALDAGTVPWRNPVLAGGLPANLPSKKTYRGVNVFLLHVAALSRGYGSPWWLTFKQAKTAGGCVRKGEKGTPIVFWRILEKKETNETGEVEKVKLPLLRYYTVFKSAQCEGLNFYDRAGDGIAKDVELNMQLGRDYWQRTSRFWTDVRNAMADDLDDGELSLVAQVDGKPLHAHLLDYAAGIDTTDDVSADQAFITETLARFTATAEFCLAHRRGRMNSLIEL